MFLEILSHLLALDIAWVLGFILNNLLWLFLLTAFVIIAGGQKKLRGIVWKFILLVGSLYIVLDIVGIMGFTLMPIFLSLIFAILLDIFATHWSEKHETALLWIFFFAGSIILTYFLPGLL